MVVIKTLSISQEYQDFLEKNPDLSPSKMLQSKIKEIKDNREFRFRELQQQKQTIMFLNNKLAAAGDQIALLQNKLNPKKNSDDGNNKKLV